MERPIAAEAPHVYPNKKQKNICKKKNIFEYGQSSIGLSEMESNSTASYGVWLTTKKSLWGILMFYFWNIIGIQTDTLKRQPLYKYLKSV